MKNRKKESFFSFFFTHPLFIFLWYSWYASQFIKKKRTAILHRHDFGAVRLLRSDKSYYWRFYWSWYRVAFQSEEIRAALLFPRFKYQLLSLCKSPNVEKAVTDYYTVTPSARWDSSGVTIAIIEDFVPVYFAQSSRRKKSGMHCFYYDLNVHLCHSVRVPTYK